MKILITGSSPYTFQFLDDDGKELNIPIAAVDIRIRPDEIVTAKLTVEVEEIDVSLLPKGITIIPIEEKE